MLEIRFIGEGISWFAFSFRYFFLNWKRMCQHGAQDTVRADVNSDCSCDCFGSHCQQQPPKIVLVLGTVFILHSVQRVTLSSTPKKVSSILPVCRRKRLTLQRKNSCPNRGWVKAAESCSITQPGLQAASTTQTAGEASNTVVRSQLINTWHQIYFEQVHKQSFAN